MGNTSSRDSAVPQTQEEKSDDGLKVAQKVKKSELALPSKSNNIIGLDFGTSTLVVSCVTPASDVPKKVRIFEEDIDYSTPTVLFIENDKVEIGNEALSRYTDLDVDNFKCIIFFEKVKLELQHNKSVNRETTVESSDGTKYYLIEVIATILKLIKNRLAGYFWQRDKPGGHKMEDFDWAITIPALWGIQARDMMREAAYLAGLCTDLPEWEEYLPTPLQPASSRNLIDIKPLEPNPHKLSLVFEPEAAAIACMELRSDDTSIPSACPGPNDCYLTVDIGGGTIDITAHQVQPDGALLMLDIPHGEICGGTEVNKRFKEFIASEVFNDPTFSRYLETATCTECECKQQEHNQCDECDSERKQHHAELFTFVNREFEKAKKKFGSQIRYTSPEPELDDSCNLSIPGSLHTVYEGELRNIQGIKIEGNTHVSYRRATQKFSISMRKMKELFEPNVIATIACIEEALKVVGRDKVKIMYLVGGFGGCSYMTSSVQYHYPNINVIRPSQPEYVVAIGACLFYKKKVLRIADATYGTETYVKYDDRNAVHKKAFKRSIDNDEHIIYANLFKAYIYKGDQIDPEYVFSNVFRPLSNNQKAIKFTIYSSKFRDIHYVRSEDKSLSDGLDILGYLNVDISSGMHLSRENREVQLVLDFSSTEIHVYGWFIHDKDKTSVKTTCDFLSTFENIKKNAQ